MRLALVAFLTLWVPFCLVVRVLRARTHRMPRTSRPAMRLPAEGGTLAPEIRRVLHFAHSDGGTVAWDTRRYPHLAVAGATGKGKTVALHSIIRSAIIGLWEVYICDPKMFELAGFTGHPGVKAVADEGPSMTKAIAAVKKELVARQRAKKADPDATFRPILLVVDEVTELVEMTGGKTKSEAVSELGSIMRLGRALDIHVVPATQQFDVKEALPSSVRRQCDAQLALGPLGRIGRQMLGWTDEQDCVPADADPGRGSFVCGSGGRPRLVQVDYADPPKPVAKAQPRKLESTRPNPSSPPVDKPAPASAPVVPSPSIFGDWSEP